MNNESTSAQNANDNQNKNMRPELGALWKKEGRSQTYLTGYITGSDGNRLNIVIFSSKTKKNPNQPDYRIFESLPPNSSAAAQKTQSESEAPQVKAQSSKKKTTASEVKDVEDDDGSLM